MAEFPHQDQPKGYVVVCMEDKEAGELYWSSYPPAGRDAQVGEAWPASACSDASGLAMPPGSWAAIETTKLGAE